MKFYLLFVLCLSALAIAQQDLSEQEPRIPSRYQATFIVSQPGRDTISGREFVDRNNSQYRIDLIDPSLLRYSSLIVSCGLEQSGGQNQTGSQNQTDSENQTGAQNQTDAQNQTSDSNQSGGEVSELSQWLEVAQEPFIQVRICNLLSNCTDMCFVFSSAEQCRNLVFGLEELNDISSTFLGQVNYFNNTKARLFVRDLSQMANQTQQNQTQDQSQDQSQQNQSQQNQTSDQTEDQSQGGAQFLNSLWSSNQQDRLLAISNPGVWTITFLEFSDEVAPTHFLPTSSSCLDASQQASQDVISAMSTFDVIFAGLEAQEGGQSGQQSGSQSE